MTPRERVVAKRKRLWLLGDGDPVATSKRLAHKAEGLRTFRGLYRLAAAGGRKRMEQFDRNMRVLGCIVYRETAMWDDGDPDIWYCEVVFAAPFVVTDFVLTDGSAAD